LTGKTVPDKVNFMKRIACGDTLNIISCKYSSGKAVTIIYSDLTEAINLTYESWDGFWDIKSGNPSGSIVLNQYGLDAYDQMLWMLSLAYLLDIDGADFRKLVEVTDRDRVKDYLFEFIISAKTKNRPPIAEESYQQFFGVPNAFEKLRQAIGESEKIKAEKLVKEFITKEWYKTTKANTTLILVIGVLKRRQL
jgi:hypothetical protein